MTPPPRITALALPEAALTPSQEAYFNTCAEKLGFIPNVLRAHAFAPAKLQAFIDMADELMLGESELSRLEREMIAVTVSAANRCHYCLTAHGAAVRRRSGDPKFGDVIEHNHLAAGLSPRQRAMLDFAAKLTESPAKIVEADRQALRDAGFSDRAIWDIASVAAFFNMSNRLASAVALEPNDEYFHMARAENVEEQL